MRRRAAACALGATLAASGVAAAYPFEIGPYLQDARSDGATVVWEGGAPATGEVIVRVGAEERRFPSPEGMHHAVRVTGLPPGAWHYRVVSQGTPRDGTIRTAAVGDHAFTFLVYGDSRSEHEEHARLIEALRGQDADLLLGTGDLVDDGGSDAQWTRMFDIEQPLLASHPLYAVAGNHEYVGDPTLARFRRLFILPQLPLTTSLGDSTEPPREDGPAYYGFHYGNALFLALDTNRPADRRQTDWLAAQMVAADNDYRVRHIFVFDHHPAFAVGDLCGSADSQGPWIATFGSRKLRAVFSGHVHAYEHLERARVRYFVTGGAGAPLDNRGQLCESYDESSLIVYRSTPHYLRVRIAGPTVALDAISVDGALLDHARLDEEPVERLSGAVPFDDTLPHPRQQGQAGALQPRTTNAILGGLLLLLLGSWAVARRRKQRRATVTR